MDEDGTQLEARFFSLARTRLLREHLDTADKDLAQARDEGFK